MNNKPIYMISMGVLQHNNAIYSAVYRLAGARHGRLPHSPHRRTTLMRYFFAAATDHHLTMTTKTIVEARAFHHR